MHGQDMYGLVAGRYFSGISSLECVDHLPNAQAVSDGPKSLLVVTTECGHIGALIRGDSNRSV